MLLDPERPSPRTAPSPSRESRSARTARTSPTRRAQGDRTGRTGGSATSRPASDLDDVIEWSKFSPVALAEGRIRLLLRGDGAVRTGRSRVPRRVPAGADPLPPSRRRPGRRRARVLQHLTRSSGCSAPAVTDDGRFLVISIDRGTFPEAQVHVLDLEDPEAGFRALVADFASKAVVLTNVGTTFLPLTDDGADLQRIVAVDLDRTRPGGWREVVPEETATRSLEAHGYGGRLVCHFLRHACSVLRVHELDGSYVRDIPTPADGVGLEQPPYVARASRAAPTSELVHFQVMSFTESGSLWAHDLATGETTLVRRLQRRLRPPPPTSPSRCSCRPATATRVPMFLSRRRDLDRSGDVPVLLYGYGGFDVPITPAFSVTHGRLDGTGRRARRRQPRAVGASTDGRGTTPGGSPASRTSSTTSAPAREWLAASGWSRPGSDRHQRRFERRSAGRRLHHPAPGAVRRRRGRGRGPGHAPLPQVHDRMGLDERLRRSGRSRAVWLAARLLAAAPRSSRRALPADARC